MEPFDMRVAAGRTSSDPSAADEAIDERLLSELFTVVGAAVPDGLKRAFDLFLTGVPARLVDIETALAEDRFQDAARAAHSLRGSAGAFGARGLSVLAEHEERVCGDADRVAAEALLEEMRIQFVSVEAILRSRLSQLAA